MKKYLIISLLLIVSLVLGTYTSVFAGQKQMTKEVEVSICTELNLKKGTIIRASNIAFLTQEKLTTEPMYTTMFVSTQKDYIIVLKQDLKVYLTNGGYYSCKYKSVNDYLKDMKKVGYETKNFSVHSVDLVDILRSQLKKAKNR